MIDDHTNTHPRRHWSSCRHSPDLRPRVAPKTKPASPLKPTDSLLAFAQSLADSTGLSPVMLAAGSAGAVLAIVGLIIFRRRRAAIEEAYDGFDTAGNLFPAARDSEAGFAPTEADADTTAVPSFGEPGEGSLFGDLGPSNVSDSQVQQPAPVAGPGGGLFGDDEKEESTVDQMSTPMVGMDASAAPGAMSQAGDFEFALRFLLP